MKTRCQDWEQLLERYHDGEVSRKERTRVQAHLESCQGCRDYLAGLERLGQMVSVPIEDAIARVDLEQMWSRVSAQMQAEERPSWQERLAVWWEEFWGAHRGALVAAGAAAALTLLVAWPLLRSDEAGSPGAPAPIAPAVVENEVIIDSLQSGEHDMVLVNVHPEDMTAVIWLLEDEEESGEAPEASPAAQPFEPDRQPAQGNPAEDPAPHAPAADEADGAGSQGGHGADWEGVGDLPPESEE